MWFGRSKQNTARFRWPSLAKTLFNIKNDNSTVGEETKIFKTPANNEQKYLHRLIVTSGKDKGREFLLVPTTMKIGRREDCYIRLSDKNISREHAILIYKPEEESYVLEDAHSTNGTYLNERRIRREVLTSGDQIRIGETSLKYTLAENNRVR
jgi:pSer/pThr/pTyr-binding forkhead associated (FHA) protein